MTDQDTPKKSRHYNPQTKGPSFKKPPVINSLAHIPFKEMAYDSSVQSRKVDQKGFEVELLQLMSKYGILPLDANEPIQAMNGRRISISFPADAKSNLAVDIQQKQTETTNEYISFIYSRGRVTQTVLTYPDYFNIRTDLADIRRVFTLGGRYQPEDVVEPDVYEGIKSRVSVVDGKPTVVKTFVVDGIEKPFLNVALPPEKYALLNGITIVQQ